MTKMKGFVVAALRSYLRYLIFCLCNFCQAISGENLIWYVKSNSILSFFFVGKGVGMDKLQNEDDSLRNMAVL